MNALAADTRRRHRPWSRRSWPWLLLLVIAGAAAAGWWWFDSRPGATPRYRTVKVERGPIMAVVSSSGTLNAVTTVQVGSQVSGQVKEVTADFNSPVKKGQLIARLDPESFELKVKQAQAEVDAARTNLLNQRNGVLVLQTQVTRARLTLDDAQRELDRKASLYQRSFISVAERDKAQFNRDAAAEALHTAEAQVKVGEAQVANATAVLRQREVALESARVDLERTAIRAPVDGVVISRTIEPGQTVAASLQAPTLFTIAQDLRQMQVDTAIDESDIGRIRLDQAASFTVDAFPGRTFRGSVVQIRKAAQTVQNVVTYVVVVRTENPDMLLVPGMTANVRVVTDQRDGALKVPNAALRYRPPGGDSAKSGDGAPGGTFSAGAGNGAKAGGSGAGGAGGDFQGRRERLARELKLDAAQQARLDEIFSDQRQRMVELRDIPEADRRVRAERLRADARQRINAILNPEQQKRYAEVVAQETGRSGGAGSSGRVWVLADDGKAKEVPVRLGLSDGNSTEVVGGGLRDSDNVIVGNVDRGGAQRQPTGGAPRLPF